MGFSICQICGWAEPLKSPQGVKPHLNAFPGGNASPHTVSGTGRDKASNLRGLRLCPGTCRPPGILRPPESSIAEQTPPTPHPLSSAPKSKRLCRQPQFACLFLDTPRTPEPGYGPSSGSLTVHQECHQHGVHTANGSSTDCVTMLALQLPAPSGPHKCPCTLNIPPRAPSVPRHSDHIFHPL